MKFKLSKYHEIRSKTTWKHRGLIAKRKETDEIYNRLISSEKCEGCSKEFENSRQRKMCFNKETGKFINILCQSCQHKLTL
jgi:hypothetical protein